MSDKDIGYVVIEIKGINHDIPSKIYKVMLSMADTFIDGLLVEYLENKEEWDKRWL